MNNDLFDIRNSRDTAGINGQVGLFNVDSADFGHAGVLHFSVLGEYFKSNSFPVLDAADTRSAGTFALGYNFLEWLQAYVSYNVAANTNSRSSPRLIQDQGDATLGVAGGYEVYDGLYVGADLRLLIFPGVGNQDLSRSALGFAPKALVTYDVRRAAPKVPLRVHLNLGGVIDKTSELGQGHTLTASEEFALDVNTYNRFTVGAALESPLPVVTPFVEYDLGVPLGTGNLVAPDNSSVSVGEVMAQQIGVGVRVTAIKDVTLNLGVNIGLARTVAYGVPATMPWNFLFGLAYNIDPSGFTRTKVVERTFERKAPPPAIAAPVEAPPSTGKVEGFALDANTGKPIPGVMVALANSDLPPVATDVARGRFLTYDLPAGPVKLEAEAPGYHPATADATIEVGKTVPVEIKLVRELKGGTLNVNVSSKKKPVQAVLTVTGASNTTIQVNGDGQSQLPPGHYAVAVAADGYDPDSKEIDIESEKTANLKFDLKKTKGEEAAAPKLVVIIKNKIVIKQQVHFATNKAVILKDSFNLLNQVADVIKTNDLKKVEVAGHTDNVGPSDVNMKLSQDRADSVKAYLVKHGITEDKLEGKGYGDTKPIAPNMTAKGREQNRRVEFTIMER
jgi:outer membrane protein OmpA-like peptidoglycan-associated protein